MRSAEAATIPHSSTLSASITTVRQLHRHSHPTAPRARRHKLVLEDHYQKKATKYWDAFYKRHKNKVSLFLSVIVSKGMIFWGFGYCRVCLFSADFLQFFKDRHYLEKDWGCFFSDEDLSLNRKVVLEVKFYRLVYIIYCFSLLYEEKGDIFFRTHAEISIILAGWLWVWQHYLSPSVCFP